MTPERAIIIVRTLEGCDVSALVRAARTLADEVERLNKLVAAMQANAAEMERQLRK